MGDETRAYTPRVHGGNAANRLSQTTKRLRSAFAIVCIAVVATTAAVPAFALEPGDPAPAIRLPALSNAPTPSTDRVPFPLVELGDFRGKVVYLDFWDSSCAPCRAALPALDRLHEQVGDQVAIVGVNLDTDPRAALRFLDQYPVRYPILSDPSAVSGQRYAIDALPTAFFIDRAGTVRSIHRGFRKTDIPAIKNKIKALIAEQ